MTPALRQPAADTGPQPGGPDPPDAVGPQGSAVEPDTPSDDTPGTARPAVSLQQRLARLDQAVAELPGPQRRALLRNRIDGLSAAELAASSGLEPGEVAVGLSRALAGCRLRVGDPALQGLLGLHERAADAFLRREAPGWTGADERALEAWFDADPMHREIYEGIALSSHDLHQIAQVRSGTWRRAPARDGSSPGAGGSGAGTPDIPDAPDAPDAAAASARPDRRRLLVSGLAWAVGIGVGVGYGWIRWELASIEAIDAATGPGETRGVDLPDGSRLVLNRNSAVQVRYERRHRHVQLLRGEAFFQVESDARRPFWVDSGSSRVIATGTAFNLCAAAPGLVLEVLDGEVELQPRRLRGDVLRLRVEPGQGRVVDEASGRTRAIEAPAAGVGDWRQGRLHFERRPLGEVADRLSRYLDRPVVVTSDALAALPVTGSAATDAPEAFLHELSTRLPLRLVDAGGGGWRLEPR